MTEKKYKVYLKDLEVGYSFLEKADAAMSVAFGEIIITNDQVNLDFIVGFCRDNKVQHTYEPEDGFLMTYGPFPELKIITSEGIELVSEGNQLTVILDELCEVSVQGITSPNYSEEFPHHVKAYNKMFKE